jgi:N-acetylneuraminate synthase
VSKQVSIAGTSVGEDRPTFIIAEIGINHNGDLETAKKLIDAAQKAGCNAVKFQKRTPETCVPIEQREVLRETPWGTMTYLQYRYKMEFGEAEFHEISQYCQDRDILWFASVWDEPSVDFLEPFDVPCYKIPSACLTDDRLLRRVVATGRPVMLSTGMSTLEMIREAVRVVEAGGLLLAHCTSTYPCPTEELNLRVIPALREMFSCPIGYSGHEVGLQTTCAAVVMGASFVERHITLNRAMWGSDQAASVEPDGFARLVRDIRVIEKALGDGHKRIYESELPVMKRLRRNLAPESLR